MQDGFVALAFALLGAWEYVVLYLAAATIASGVVVNFALHAAAPGAAVAEERIVVATLTMTLFFVAAFVLARYGPGRIGLSPAADLAARLAGSLLVVFAAVVNIAGRIALGRYWSNQIEIVAGHEVVRTWPYSWSRHPLYGSLLLFGTGMGMLALNPLVVVATLAVFLPAMRYRAVREEALLVASCGDDYRDFQREAPMLLPRIPEALSKVVRALLGAMQAWAASTVVLDLMLLSAVLTLGLSFIMARDDFRIAYKFKPVVITVCVIVTWQTPALAFVLWIPAIASIMSLSGHCPGTLLLRLLRR